MIENLAPEPARRTQRRRGGLVCLAFWTVFVLLALWWLLHAAGGPSAWLLSDSGAPKTALERARDWFRLVHLNFQRIYPWILLGPYVAWLAWRFSLERGRLHLSLPVHLAGCAAFAVASQAINSRANMTVARVVIINEHQRTDLAPAGRELKSFRVEVTTRDMGELMHNDRAERRLRQSLTNRAAADAGMGPSSELFLNGELTNLFPELTRPLKPPGGARGPTPLRPLSTLLDLLAYGAVVGLVHSVHFYRRYRERERRALFLESNLAKARLQALQAQLQPHFLFNALNAIATLLRRDPRAAEQTLTSLSELLRLALSQSDRQETTLREELSFIQRYVEIQQTRFGDRLRFDLEIEPAALDCLVPALVLQPLVENAIRHGIEPADHAGCVRVTARRRDGSLHLTVEDDGVGLGPEGDKAPGTGIGLANLRARLEALYGARQKLELAAGPVGGVVVRLELPVRLTASTEAAPMTTAV